MAGNLQELTTADFDATVANGVTLVDFWATWCGPCQMQTPILEQQVLPSVSGKAKIAKVNVDQARDLAVRFAVKSIPALIIFKDGKVVQQFVGLQRGDVLVKAIEAAIAAV
jgi:thioredoxin 1